MFDAEKTVAPAYRLLRRLKNRALNLVAPPVVVLCYHRVALLENDPHRIAVTPENFRAQMQYLRRNFSCLRLEESWGGRETPAVVITFDDGYADNLHQALPILEEAELPATFFVSTGTLGSSQEFWSDDLERLVLLEGDDPPRFALADPEFGGTWPTVTAQERLALHDLLHRFMLRIKPQRRDEWMEQLRCWARAGRVGRTGHRVLTREEVRSLAQSPLVTIGAHSVTHTPLALLSEEEQRREIFQSRDELELLTGGRVELFSYPFGGYGQYDGTTRRLCREAGFRCAVTTFPGQVRRFTDRWQLPRQLVRNWDVDTFAARLDRFWA